MYKKCIVIQIFINNYIKKNNIFFMVFKDVKIPNLYRTLKSARFLAIPVKYLI